MALSRQRNCFLALLLLIAIKSWAVCLGTDPYSKIICIDSPTEYLRLGELGNLNGKSAQDSSGNSHTGGYEVSIPAQAVSGQLGVSGLCGNSAVSFNPSAGGGAEVKLCGGGGTQPSCLSSTSTWLSPIESANWSLEFWLKWSLLPSATGSQSLFQKENSNLLDGEWQLVGTNVGPIEGIGFDICNNNSFCNTQYVLIDTLAGANLNSTTSYYYVVVTWKTSTTTATIYVNGTSAGTTSVVSGSPPTGDAAPFYMMARLNNASLDTPAHAIMDEVAFYPSVLSGARITAHYNAGIAPCRGGDWPYLSKAPCLPKFNGDNYLTRFVQNGFNTGQFSSKSLIPRFLTLGYAPFSVSPRLGLLR